MMYTQYLREIAGSRVCTDLPGEGPFTYRLVEYLAVGSCIVAYPHKARLHVPLRDREHIAYTKEDLSDLVELCDYFLRNPLERHRLAANAQSFFDRYLHRDQLAAYQSARCLSSPLDTGQGVAGRRRVSAQLSEKGPKDEADLGAEKLVLGGTGRAHGRRGRRLAPGLRGC
jgi:Glycosyl transferases group 1